MNKNLANLFKEANGREMTTNTRGLEGTAQLNSVASGIVDAILRHIAEHTDELAELVAESQKSHDAMDKLINECYELKTVNIDFLKELDEKILEGMLKSQQSKRSRAKSKLMTLDNYRNMMMGAVAESLIRSALGKEKTAGRARRVGDVEYTDEQLEELRNDQDKLRKEIRNIQSKKSIMKSKEGFSEDDERWKKLLEAEEKLKALRIPARGVAVDTTKRQLAEMLDGIDLNKLKVADAKKLLQQALELAKGNALQEEPQEEQQQDEMNESQANAQ